MGLFGKLPRLKTVDRATSNYALIFSYFNLFLGFTMFIGLSKTREFFIINDVLTYQVWGIAFFTAGFIQLLAHIFNRWAAIRAFFLVGFSLKLFWIIALLFRQIDNVDSSLILLVMFSALGALQLVCFANFPHPKEVKLWTRRD